MSDSQIYMDNWVDYHKTVAKNYSAKFWTYSIKY